MNLDQNPSSGGRTYTCSWCGLTSEGIDLSCPACGAEVDVRAVVTRSGWTELPGRRDMAKLQFGQSYCQVEGTYVPVADMNLAAGDSVYFAHHVLLWKDPAVAVTSMGLKGAWKRMLAGMPLIMTQAAGPGHIAFSRDLPGELIALPLQHGQTIDVREHLFMVATGAVSYDWFASNVWFTTKEGDETETHYPLGMFLDRFTAQGAPGLLLLHAGGNVFVRTLEPGQSILIKPTAFLFKDTTVQMRLHIERPAGTWRSWRSWGDRYFWLRLHGPGRVAVQSAFEPLEDNGRTIVDHSGATERRW
ncbi:MAG TPA: AIM24 family protein [Thermoanaerobaculia bacterium]|nr:AIM24 family protein [Thermoanaerobaculia bacterium]